MTTTNKTKTPALPPRRRRGRPAMNEAASAPRLPQMPPIQLDEETAAMLEPVVILPEFVFVLRSAMGLNMDEFGTMFNITGRAVDYWETGKRTVDGPARILFNLYARKYADRVAKVRAELTKLRRKK